MRNFYLIFVLTILGLSGCTAASPTATSAPTPPAVTANVPTVPDGFAISRLPLQTRQPTQMIAGPDGRLWLAQLNGGENDGTGQIIALDLETGASDLLLDGLLKPTGLAVLDGYLWIAAKQDLLRAPLQEDGTIGSVETVLADLPFNGRSNGTVTVTPQNTLLYETSGRRTGNQAAPDSGILWELDPSDPENPTPIASGLKGAYAHTYDENGRLWITEIGDGTFNGGPPPDELNLVVAGADFGWPQCIGFREPALNYDGTAEICAKTRAPVVLFPPRSTPTSVAAAPWDANMLLVALWLDNVVVQVSVQPEAGDNATGQSEPFVQNLDHPQHLLVWEDGSLLLSEYGTGAIYRITRP